MGICTNRKPTHDFPYCQYNVLFDLPPFGRNSSVNYEPQPHPTSTPIWELWWTYGVHSGTDRNRVSTFLFDFCTYDRPILHSLSAIHNAADRQTTAIGCLCYSFGGLKYVRRIDGLSPTVCWLFLFSSSIS